VNEDTSVADNFATDMTSEIAQRLANHHLFFCPVIIGFDHPAGDIRA
jgi:hypothetical protein